MSDIIALCSLSVVACIFALVVKQVNPAVSLVIIIAASVVVVIYLVVYLNDVIEYVNTLFNQVNINSQYIKILLKCTGICFITEFSCDLCKESGNPSVSSQISLAGKLITLVMAIPLFKEVLSISLSLAGVE
jgi:stage III sporulation protein AD